MSSIDRRTMLTAMVGICVAAGALGAATTSASAVPRTLPPRPEVDAREVATEATESEAKVHHAQWWRWRRRRRFRAWRPWRRRRVVYY